MSDTAHGSGEKRSHNPIFYVSIFGAGVIALIVATLLMTGESPTSQTNPESDEVVEQRPTGAGTNPDGVVDEMDEGLTNETSTDTFIDSSAASGPDGINATESTGPEPETSAEGLEPAVGEGTVDRMLPQDEATE